MLFLFYVCYSSAPFQRTLLYPSKSVPTLSVTDILEWAVGGFAYGYDKCTVCMYSVYVKEKTWSWINKYNVH